MNTKLDGAHVAHSAASQHRMVMSEQDPGPPPEAIRWTTSMQEQSAAARRERIAVVAYYLSEARGFAPGHEAEDWLMAQAQVDALDAAIFD